MGHRRGINVFIFPEILSMENLELTSNGVKGYCLVLKKASSTDFGGRQSGNWSSQISSTGTSPDGAPMLA